MSGSSFKARVTGLGATAAAGASRTLSGAAAAGGSRTTLALEDPGLGFRA